MAELCANLQFMEEVASVNVSEGLMHLLNDVGFPEHHMSETLPCLKLCCDLVATPDFDGFFYSNDIKASDSVCCVVVGAACVVMVRPAPDPQILVDVILRELTNLPLSGTKDAPSSTCDGDIVDGLDGPVERCLGEVPPTDELVRQM